MVNLAERLVRLLAQVRRPSEARAAHQPRVGAWNRTVK
jgi:hypothetical protein